MDLSKSMESEREKLVKLGELLAQTLPNITSNFRLGFGSFINKVSSSPGQVEYALLTSPMKIINLWKLFTDQSIPVMIVHPHMRLKITCHLTQMLHFFL